MTRDSRKDVSRREARRIAQGIADMKYSGYSAGDALLFDELPLRKPSIYDVQLSGAWVVYLQSNTSFGLGPSTIVVIDCKTGALRYVGSAGD